MAKKIIVLETGNPWQGQLSVTYALWATVPANLQVKYVQTTDWKSAYSSATTAEIDAIRAGSVTEKVGNTNVPLGTGVPVIKGILLDAFNTFQDSVTNDNRYQYYGTFYEGTVWTTGGL
jgi:hypothetical protein